MINNGNEDLPFLKLRKEHQALADELKMTAEEYLDYRSEIDELEGQRLESEYPPIRLKTFSSIKLIKNIENLGYSKSFLTRDDAESLFDKIKKWESETSYLVGIDEEENTNRDEVVSTYMATGVKYNFSNVGISIYCVFAFSQFNYSNHNPRLNHFQQTYIYDHRSGEFDEIDKDDMTTLSF